MEAALDAQTLASHGFLLVAGLLVLLLTVWVVYQVGQHGRRDRLAHSYARHRMAWQAQLKQDVSAFSALAMKHYYSVKDLDRLLAEKVFAQDVRELNQLRVRVRLSLDPYQTIDSDDTKLIRSMRRVIVHFETQHYNGLDYELLRIERCAQRILHQERHKSSRLARLGSIEPDTAVGNSPRS